jgi:hypothetical protein
MIIFKCASDKKSHIYVIERLMIFVDISLVNENNFGNAEDNLQAIRLLGETISGYNSINGRGICKEGCPLSLL